MKTKYKIGDTLLVGPNGGSISATVEDKGNHTISNLFTKFVITDISDTSDYIGYYSIPHIKGKQFSMALDIKITDKDPDYRLSIKEKLKKL